MAEKNKGPYFAYELLEDEYSFGFSIGVHNEEYGKDFQFSVIILDMVLAIGWVF